MITWLNGLDPVIIVSSAMAIINSASRIGVMMVRRASTKGRGVLATLAPVVSCGTMVGDAADMDQTLSFVPRAEIRPCGRKRRTRMTAP